MTATVRWISAISKRWLQLAAFCLVWFLGRSRASSIHGCSIVLPEEFAAWALSPPPRGGRGMPRVLVFLGALRVLGRSRPGPGGAGSSTTVEVLVSTSDYINFGRFPAPSGPPVPAGQITCRLTCRSKGADQAWAPFGGQVCGSCGRARRACTYAAYRY